MPNVTKLTVLVVDASGRGAALVHKYSQSPRVSKIIAIPGNELMDLNSKVPVKIYPDLKTTSTSEILAICKKEKVDLVDVAQDNAVEAGVSDVLLENGFKVVGPIRSAGQIEWDKAWARRFMEKYKLPIPGYHIFNSEKEAIKFLKRSSRRKWFIKASGLAEGKGAIPAENLKESLAAIKQIGKFGKSGETFVIEEWLDGEEFSMFAITDGNTYQVIGSAQDHKRLFTGDEGPNTGGMGCSTPALIVNSKIFKQGEEIFKKTIQGLKKEGRLYKGVLYLGGIMVKEKVYIIEFNARWGSPEAEVLVPGITNDLVDIGLKVFEGKLKSMKIKTDGKARIAVTGALRPGAETKKRELFGLDSVIKIPGITVYGARVFKKGKKYYVSGGRLFQLVAEGKNVIDARRHAYDAMSQLFIERNNLHFRIDIGWHDVARMQK